MVVRPELSNGGRQLPKTAFTRIWELQESQIVEAKLFKSAN